MAAASGSPAQPLQEESGWSLAAQVLAIAGAAYSYGTLPDRLISAQSSTFSTVRWAAPILWGAFLVSIVAALPPPGARAVIREPESKAAWRRLAIALFLLSAVAQWWVISLLVHFILHGKVASNGTELLHTATRIEGTTIVLYAFLFWLVDSGGPIARRLQEPRSRDFLFPQQESAELASDGWRPSFVDYLYVAFTNATAFSPTDVMPLSPRVKLLMMSEAAASAITLLMVAARAVNILR
ncbi:MAG TPA: hypothetical protein VFA66_11330 [Gaiellaceae bacterium]|nr:hypothetical protein [Gaiellaceae bacterium]